MKNGIKNIIILGASFFLIISCLAPSCNKTPQYYYVEGEKAFQRKDFKIAYKYFKHALKLNPEYYDVIFRMAVLKVEMDSLKSAVWDFSYAIKLKPTGDSYYQRACAKFKLKDYVGACSDWQNGCDLLHNKSCDKLREQCK